MKYGLVLGGLLLFSCSGKRGDSGDMTHREEVKLEQYMVAGQQLYIQHCSNCHQVNGKGLAKLFPPIDESDFVDQNPKRVVCLIRNGMSGEVVVNGVVYDQPMPAMPQLSNLEVAEIVTYIYNSWGRKKGIVSVKDTEKILGDCTSTFAQ